MIQDGQDNYSSEGPKSTGDLTRRLAILKTDKKGLKGVGHRSEDKLRSPVELFGM